jgi:hypothetical protein
MAEVNVTVTLNPLELKLLRRALAKAVDDGDLEVRTAAARICELDMLRWAEQDRQQDQLSQGGRLPVGEAA